MKTISAKILSVILAITLMVCALPLQTLVFAEETPPDVIIANEEEGVVLDETSLSQEYVKDGKYSFKAIPHSTDRFFCSQYHLRRNKHFEAVDISGIVGEKGSATYQGALRFWVYVEDIATLADMRDASYRAVDRTYVRIGTTTGSVPGANQNEVAYASWNKWIVNQVKRTGWNEVILKFSDATFHNSKSFDPNKIDYICFTATGATLKYMWIDNIRVSADTEYTPEPDDVVLIDDETCAADANGVALLSVSNEQAKVGSKSLKSTTNNSAIAYAGFWGGKAFEPVIDISKVSSNGSDGALRFWFYIDDVALLDKAKTKSSGAQVKIGSGNDPDNNMIYWTSWIKQVTKNGWNEVVLKFNSSHKAGTPKLEEIDTLYIKFPDGTSNMTVYLDDIRITSDTSSTSCVELPIICAAANKTGNLAIAYNKFTTDISKVEDKYLKLSLYVARTNDETADISSLVKDGQIELTSSGNSDANELAWGLGSLNLSPGWNTVYLPFAKAAKIGSFDDTSVNYFRIYNLVSNTSIQYTLRVRDVSVISHNSISEYALPVKSTGTSLIEKKFTSVDASNLKNPHLQLSFYVARTDDESSIEGLATHYSGIELTSSGWCDNEEITWLLKDYDVQPGWNTVSLPFLRAGKQGAQPFDITAIDYFRIHTVGNTETDKFKLEVKDVSIVDVEFEAGDVNKDAYTNSADLVLLRQILLGSVSKRFFDVNKDGIADVRDLVSLKKKLAS